MKTQLEKSFAKLILGIPRSELRPDLWPPDGLTATPTTPPAAEGGEDAA